mmetsp:Transcript_21880/g.72421  ORF Transcript_21880/g.72421 Transcript_21880/m.72421 type:complete len:221 (-) Transcript_21880:1442-2104(-)
MKQKARRPAPRLADSAKSCESRRAAAAGPHGLRHQDDERLGRGHGPAHARRAAGGAQPAPVARPDVRQREDGQQAHRGQAGRDQGEEEGDRQGPRDDEAPQGLHAREPPLQAVPRRGDGRVGGPVRAGVLRRVEADHHPGRDGRHVLRHRERHLRRLHQGHVQGRRVARARHGLRRAGSHVQHAARGIHHGAHGRRALEDRAPGVPPRARVPRPEAVQGV